MAVKIAKCQNTDEIPKTLALGGAPVIAADVVNSFAKHFKEKIQRLQKKADVCVTNAYIIFCIFYAYVNYTYVYVSTDIHISLFYTLCFFGSAPTGFDTIQQPSKSC